MAPARRGAEASRDRAVRMVTGLLLWGGLIGIEDPFDVRRVIMVAQVTVITDSLTWADIDATAAYAQGRDALRWLHTRQHRTAIVVYPDGLVSKLHGRRGETP